MNLFIGHIQRKVYIGSVLMLLMPFTALCKSDFKVAYKVDDKIISNYDIDQSKKLHNLLTGSNHKQVEIEKIVVNTKIKQIYGDRLKIFVSINAFTFFARVERVFLSISAELPKTLTPWLVLIKILDAKDILSEFLLNVKVSVLIATSAKKIFTLPVAEKILLSLLKINLSASIEKSSACISLKVKKITTMAKIFFICLKLITTRLLCVRVLLREAK
ncbi:hypothetical protein OA416_02980 [Paracoccaceae bacterium]|nr:hypothetical protein [Paracoccaceae bacterium]